MMDLTAATRAAEKLIAAIAALAFSGDASFDLAMKTGEEL